MDTVEELNGTYFYAGKANLTATELFFMVFIFNTADQFGIKDITAVYALYAGMNDQKTRTKPGTAIQGTSRLSKGIRKHWEKGSFRSVLNFLHGSVVILRGR